MADLNFPKDRTELDPAGTGPLQTGDEYTANGTTWVYDATVGAWGSGASGESLSDLYLSKINDDTAAGEIAFEKLTTHEGGVNTFGVTISGSGNSGRYGNRGIGYSSSGNSIDVTNTTEADGASNQSALQAKMAIQHDNNTVSSFVARLHTGSGYTFSGTKAFYVANFTNPGITNAQWSGTGNIYGFYSDLGDAGGSNKIYHIYCPSAAQTYLGGPIEQPVQTSGNSLQLNGGGASTGFTINSDGLIRSNPTKLSTNSSKSNFVKIDTNGYLRKYDGSIRNMENVQNAATFGLLSATDLIKQLQPRMWTDKESGELGLGFIAEEVQAIAGDNAITFIEQDGEQLVDNVHGAALEIALVRALQEALTKIETLETRLSDAGIA